MSHRSKLGPGQIKKITPYLIILLAFGLQMAYLRELGGTFPQTFGAAPFCGVDAQAHWDRAMGFLDGSLPGDKVYYFLPFYPIFLAIQRQLFGPSLLFPVFMQGLLQLIGIAALYGLGRLLFSPLTGVLAALGLATYNYYIFYLPCFDQALLTAPFLTLALFLMLNYDARRRELDLLASGIVFALAILSRPTVLMVLPIVVLWLIWRRRSWLSLGRGLVFLIGPVIIAITPFTWHNYQIDGKFVLISNNFGINLFTGNNPDASGYDSLAHVQTQPAVPRFLETIRRVHAGETSFAAEAVRYAREQSGDALRLNLRKTWLWFGETEKPLIEPFFPLTVTQSRTLAWLPLTWQAMMIVAILGILLVHGRVWPRTALLWAVYAIFSAFTIMFFIQMRFRLPFVPFVLLSAASLLAMAPTWSRESPRRFWGFLIMLLILLPLVPSLGIFIVLFIGLGVWPYVQQKKEQILYRRLALAVLGYVFIVILWARANALASDVSQSIDIYLGPPLAASSVLGQTFEMDCDGLNQIEVTLGTFDYPHNQPITFHLTTDTSGQEILFAETFDGVTVEDQQQRRFFFEPIADSAGRSFFFFITSPTSTPDNAITARGYSDTPIDYYPDGQAFAGQLGALQPLQADFAFGAYCDLSLWQKVQGVFAQPRLRSPEGSS